MIGKYIALSNNISPLKDRVDIYQNNQNMNFKIDKNDNHNKDMFFKRNFLLNKYYYNYFNEKSEKKKIIKNNKKNTNQKSYPKKIAEKNN